MHTIIKYSIGNAATKAIEGWNLVYDFIFEKKKLYEVLIQQIKVPSYAYNELKAIHKSIISFWKLVLSSLFFEIVS